MKGQSVKATLAASVALALVVAETQVAATEFQEVRDAGDSPETAQTISATPGSAYTITGSLQTKADLDMFRISIPAGAMFTATTVLQDDQTLVDSKLFLFDQLGVKLMENDDDPRALVSLRSTIKTGPVAGGTYYLAIQAYYVDNNFIESKVSYRIAVSTDTILPRITLTKIGTDALGKSFIEVTAQDSGSGLAAIDVRIAVNSTVSISSFSVGTVSPVVVRATKINQSVASSIELEVTDSARNITVETFSILLADAQCTVCHKKTETVTVPCGNLDYLRHKDHGDPDGACPPNNP